VPLAALSVDLDEIPCYTRIHGLAPPTADAARAVYRHALPRFERLFNELSLSATFFAIGDDLSLPENADAVARLHQRGHEIANHSHHHLYDLTRRDPARIRTEICGGSRAIRRATGARPVGFRAPGYTVTDTLLSLLRDEGYLYDSSVFPCPPYYSAKLLALTAIRLLGRESHSIMDTPRVLASPADPYRTAARYHYRGDGIIELPVGVTRATSFRLPYIGTTVMMWGPPGARLLTRLIAGRPLVNLELHGIDLSDAPADGLDFLLKHRADLRRPLQKRTDALRAAIDLLHARGYDFVTLAEAARRLADD
jgi:peptidoglycan/xylan/chitin deacetylase (PgdA/CDA1 family)